MASEAVEVFISYSHKDEALRQELDAHLKILERQGHISAWHDRKILPGDEWDGEISTYLDQADLILLLVSADFLASDYCWNIEITRAMARHEAGEAIVVPIILRPVEWKDAPFSKLQAMPKNAQPVITWDPQDLAFAEIASGLRQRAKQLIASRRDQHHQTQKQAARTQYQQKVSEYLEDGQLSFVEVENLQDLAEQLGLTRDEAEAIKTEALGQRQAYDTKLERYKQSYRKALDHENPLSPDTLARLKERQDILHLQAMDVQQIEQAIYAEWEIKQRQRQEQAAADRLRQEREEVERQQAEAERQQQAADRLRQEQEEADRVAHQQAAERLAQDHQRKAAEALAQKRAEEEALSSLVRQPDPKLNMPRLEAGQRLLEVKLFNFEVATLGNKGQEVSRTSHTSKYFSEDLGQGVELAMVAIPGGAFLMGSLAGEGDDSERPQHEVNIQPFYLGKYPVTQTQWRAVAAMPQVAIELNPDPSNFKGENRPVEQVSWHDAIEFCARLSRYTDRRYRLPSEAEWEYACRAGTTTPFHFGPEITQRHVNCKRNLLMALATIASGETTDVGNFKLANTFGLYDMHGNVFEWCADHWHGNYDGAPTDGTAWLSSDESARRLLRGGSWYFNPRYCRSASRNDDPPDDRYDRLGFRVVCAAARAL